MQTLNSGRQLVTYYNGWGGNKLNSIDYADLFRTDAPHDFGMMYSNKIYSALNTTSHRIFQNMLYNEGSHVVANSDVYKWQLHGDTDVDFRITELLEVGNTTPGKGGATFRVAIDKGWVSEPSMLQFEDNTFPMAYVIGSPQQVGESYYVTLQLNTQDLNAYVDPSQIQVGMTLTEVATSVTGELNQKAGGDYYNSSFSLQAQIGISAREVSVTDKLIRQEIRDRAARGTTSNPEHKRLGEGYAFRIFDTTGKEIPSGMFVNLAVQRLMDRTDEDIEVLMHYGETNTIRDLDTGFIRRTSAGFRKIVLDGWTMYHNADISIDRVEDFLRSIFYQRNGFSERKIVVATGEGGIELMHTMISDVASSYLTVDTTYLNKTNSPFHANALSFGTQFTHYRGLNGVEITQVYNPMLDDRKYCKRRHPERTEKPIDSWRMDIMDFARGTGYDKNMKTISEANVDSFAYTAPMLDLSTGIVNNGSKVASFDKGFLARREKSMALWVCDASRVGSIIYEPEFA
jgi:hypothetical protein